MKIQVKIQLPYQNQIVTIFQELIIKRTIEGVRKKSEIVAILDKYKNTLNNFINNLNTKSTNCLKLIDKKISNMPNFKSSLLTSLEKNCKNENTLVILFELLPKITDLQVHLCNHIVSFNS